MPGGDDKANFGIPIGDEPAEATVAEAVAAEEMVTEVVDDACVKPTLPEEPAMVLYTEGLPTVEADNEKQGHSCCGFW
jgi:hypothetical protein